MAYLASLAYACDYSLKRLHTLTLLLLPFLGIGQTSFQTIGENQSLRINSNGSLAVDLETLNPAFNASSTANHFLNQAGIWVVAEDYDNNFYTSIQHFKALDSMDYWPGPVDTLTGQTGNINEWDKVWQISKDQILQHQQDFDKPDYLVPDEINDWPVPGTNGFISYLAPFIDANFNSKYDPENGDYPYIKGENAWYCIFNDLADEHTASFGVEVGIEVHLMAYTIEGSNSIFLEYYIVSRRPVDYKDVKVGFFMGGQCGNPFDNFAATFSDFPPATVLYNGDLNDEGYFGSEIPYVSATFLNENLSSSIAFGSDGPTENQHYVNFMNSRWKNGDSLNYGDDGKGSGESTSFIYNQSPSNQQLNWTEESVSNTPGIRNILGVIDGRPLQKGEYIKLEICLAAGVKSGNDIKQEIRDRGLQDQRLFRQTSATKFDDFGSMSVNVYPNPTNGSFTLENLPLNSQIKITDFQGVTMHEFENKGIRTYRCNINLTPGIYMLEVKNNLHSVRKLINVSHHK